MAFTLIRNAGGVTDPCAVELIGSGAIAVGDILWRQLVGNSTQGYLISAADAWGTPGFSKVFGVAASTLASGTGVVKVVPVISGQLWEADCASSTYLTHTLIVHEIMNATTIRNTTTNVNNTGGVFLAYSMKGARDDKKLVGEFIRVSAATA